MYIDTIFIILEIVYFVLIKDVNCRDGTQWIGGREKKRLFCTVGSLEKYNESLMQRKKQFDDKRDSADANVVRRHWNSNSSKQNSEYVEKLKGGLSNPFPLDPSFPEKYPLPQRFVLFAVVYIKYHVQRP
jgi:hypothetical protein